MTCAFYCIWTTRLSCGTNSQRQTVASWLVSSYQLWAVWPEGGSVGALPACRESAVERLVALCSEMQPGRKLNRQAQERQKGILWAAFIHVLVSVSNNSALPFIGKRSRNQEEILEPQGFILWLHNLEEKKTHLSFFLQSTETDNFTSHPIHLTSLLSVLLPFFSFSLLVLSLVLILGAFLFAVAAIFVCLLGQDLRVSNAEAPGVLSWGLSTTWHQCLLQNLALDA